MPCAAGAAIRSVWCSRLQSAQRSSNASSPPHHPFLPGAFHTGCPWVEASQQGAGGRAVKTWALGS